MTNFAVIISLASAAEPEAGFDAHGFVLHAADGDVRDPLTMDRPGPWEQGDLWFTGLAEYADRPLVRVTAPTFGGGEPIEEVALTELVALNMNAGVAAHDYLRFDVTAPVFFVAKGLEGYQDPTIGDVRVATMIALLRPPHVIGGGGPGLGVSGNLTIPSGDSTALLGQPGIAGGFALSGTWEGTWYTVTGEVGGQFNPTSDLENLVNSDQFVAGAAFNVLPDDRTGITAETHLYAPFPVNEVEGTGTPAEVLLSLRHGFPKGPTITVGGAAGLTEGASAARFRAFLGLSFAMLTPARPPDRDALANVSFKDRCPGDPETMNGWQDDDGCPDELGRFTVRVTEKGTPVDDAVLKVRGPDGEMSYRSSERPSFAAVPGTPFQATASIPPRCLYGTASGTAGDSSSELVVELVSRFDTFADVEVVDQLGNPITNPSVRWSGGEVGCLPEAPATAPAGGNIVRTSMGPGRYHFVVEVPGYKIVERDAEAKMGGTHLVVVLEPSRVVLEAKRIKINDTVYFEFNKAVIKPESFGLLEDVANVISAHPEVGRVQVEGHTDNKGNDTYNLKLSQARAESVRAFLVKKGVPVERLVPVGFGESRPIETNNTEEGQGANRRVEFNLIDQAVPAGGAP